MPVMPRRGSLSAYLLTSHHVTARCVRVDGQRRSTGVAMERFFFAIIGTLTRTFGQTDSHTHRQTETDRQRLTDRHTDTQTHRHTVRRQTDTCTVRETEVRKGLEVQKALPASLAQILPIPPHIFSLQPTGTSTLNFSISVLPHDPAALFHAGPVS